MSARSSPTCAADPGAGGARDILLDLRLAVARCTVDYAGRPTAHLPLATRLLMVKGDGSISIHADGGASKPLNWMSRCVVAA